MLLLRFCNNGAWGNGMQGDEGSDSGTVFLIRAVEYVRMSTEHQQYSTENQAAKIREYAALLGFEIVKTYCDSGKSGLNIGGRQGLQELIKIVDGGTADFEHILVYDVSRWGRFQNTDEAAHYEFLCEKAGITVHYCAEQFANDGSPASTIFKSVKRAMAGEYSRELSVKVFAGQCRLIGLGYRQGGPAGYGLRRTLVDHHGVLKAELSRGEHKSIQTDRVILMPGPADEIQNVNRIYRWFVEDELKESEIAGRLNAEGVQTDLDRAWTRTTVQEVLTNEKYIGNNVYNRISFKLKKKRVVNTPDRWVRKEGAFEGIVPPELFLRAQEIVLARSRRFTDGELLDLLRKLFQDRGFLSGLIISEAESLPSPSVYTHRFGSLVRAYELVGFTPDRDFRYLDANRLLRKMHPEILAKVQAEITSRGGLVACDPLTDLLRINDEFTVSLVLARCHSLDGGKNRWKVRFDTSLRPDVTVAVRLDPPNLAPLDYYLLPKLDFAQPRISLADRNPIEIESYHFANLNYLFGMTERTWIRRPQ